MAVQAPYVEYIKISRTNELGQDLTPTLEALTQIKLPFTNGVSVTYYIISRTRRNDYFLFSLSKNGNAAPLAADKSILNYDFTGSIDGSEIDLRDGFLSGSSMVGVFPTINGTGSSVSFLYNASDNKIETGTYPETPISIIASNFNVTSSYEVFVDLYKADDIYTPSSIVKLTTSEAIQGGSLKGPFTREFTTGIGTVTPGDTFFLGASSNILPFAGGPFVKIQGGDGKGSIAAMFITSSTELVGPTLETIPEPYLISRFEGTDCDVLLNNEELYRENPFLQDIDYSGNPFVPINFNLLLSGSAAKGTVPASYYTTQYHAGPRYRGTKNQSLDVNLYSPNTPRFNEDFLYVGNTNLSSIQDGTQLFDIKQKTIIQFAGIVLEFFFGYVPYESTPLSPGFSSSIVLPNDVDYITPETVEAVNQTNLMNQPPYEATFVNRSVNGVRLNSNTIKKLNSEFSNFRINYEVKGSVTLGGSSSIPVFLGLTLFSTTNFSSGITIPRSVNYTSEDYFPIYFPETFYGGTTYDIDAQGTIPADKINKNRNFLAFAIKGFPLSTTTSITTSDLSIKIWATGVPENIGNFGQTPSITQNDVNIYEYEWGGGTTPEILDWGAVRLGKILQVSSKDLVKTIDASSDIETKIIPQKSSNASNASTTARGYRFTINPETGATSYPDNSPSGSIPTSSVFDPNFNPLGSSIDFYRSFWLGPKEVSEYSEVLETNNIQNTEISFFPYPNQTNAGSDPTIPTTTKVLTTSFGVPGISNYGLTSSYGNFNPPNTGSSDLRYGFISSSSPYIHLYRNRKISRLKRDSNGFYQSGNPIQPNWDTLGNQINTDLNNGGRWFVTVYNELEWPNGQGDFNSALTTGSLSPFNIGYSTKDSRGNYPKPFHYKGVWEILGTRDDFSDFFYLLCDENFYIPTNLGTSMNIGGNVPGNSLGMLIWKARATNKSDFVMVQDSVTGGVGAGAFINKFAPDYIKEHFEEITKKYGANTPS